LSRGWVGGVAHGLDAKRPAAPGDEQLRHVDEVPGRNLLVRDLGGAVAADEPIGSDDRHHDHPLHVAPATAILIGVCLGLSCTRLTSALRRFGVSAFRRL
jgi:hypothetical protein